MPTVTDAYTFNSTVTCNGTTTLAAATTVSGALTTTSTVNLSGSTITFPANSVDSAEIVAGAIDLAHMSANSVDSDQYVDGSIDTVHIAADAIDGTLIADDAIDSEHYAAGSIDNEHLAANSVDSDQYVDGSVDPVHLASGYREVGSDAALTLAATDRTIQLQESTSGTKAATMTATHAGHLVFVRLEARSGGQYDLAVTGGTVTLDAANEACAVVYSGSAWELQALMGATFA